MRSDPLPAFLLARQFHSQGLGYIPWQQIRHPVDLGVADAGQQSLGDAVSTAEVVGLRLVGAAGGHRHGHHGGPVEEGPT